MADEPTEPGLRIAARLSHAIATACNDDYSKPGTRERERHVERIAAMHEAVNYLRDEEDNDG